MPMRIANNKLSVESNLWLMVGSESLGGAGRFELLQRIAETGSIRQAAIGMDMSYRAAWGAVEVMNQRLGVPLVTRLTGGVGGGGASLSAAGHTLLKAWAQLQATQAQHTVRLNRRLQKVLATAAAKTTPTKKVSPGKADKVGKTRKAANKSAGPDEAR